MTTALTGTRPFSAEYERLWDQRAPALACLVPMALSLVIFAFNTRYGIGVYVDSTRYMGLSPAPYDAPVYHWLLMGGKALGLQITTAAAIVALVTLLANVALIFGLIGRATGGWVFPAIGTTLIMVSPQFVTLHSIAMSEAPFLTFLFLSIWTALDYFRDGSRRSLALSSLLLGIATLTRFTAPPLGAAIVCLILARPGRDWRTRLGDSAILAAVGGAIFFLWAIVSQATEGQSIGRALWFYGNMGSAQWMASLKSMASWILPDPVPLTVRVILLCAVLGFAAWQFVVAARAFRANAGGDADGLPASEDPAIVLPLILGLLFVFYLAFVLLSVFIEANLVLTGRYAFPAYAFLVMLLTIQAAALAQRTEGRPVLLIALAVLAGVVGTSHAVRSASRTAKVFTEGYGYRTTAYRHSPTMAAVRELPANVVIYSNAPEVITLLASRPAKYIPHERMLRTNLPEPGNPVSLQIERLREDARSAPVRVVMIDHVDWRFYLASEDSLQRSVPLTDVRTFSDGRIYSVPADAGGTGQ